MALDYIFARVLIRGFLFFYSWGKEVWGRKVRGGFRYGIIDTVAGRAGEVVTYGLLIEVHVYIQTYIYRYGNGKSWKSKIREKGLEELEKLRCVSLSWGEVAVVCLSGCAYGREKSEHGLQNYMGM